MQLDLLEQQADLAARQARFGLQRLQLALQGGVEITVVITVKAFLKSR